MADLQHWFGDDLRLDARGDLLLADGVDLSNQRVVRRLMTILSEYLWHLEYGASVPIRIGELLDLPLVSAVIRGQMYLEDAVARSPEPDIQLTGILNGVFCSIRYTNALTTEQETFSFEVLE